MDRPARGGQAGHLVRQAVDWQPGAVVRSADTPEHLVEYLEEQASL
jgi:hypothetical protein